MLALVKSSFTEAFLAVLRCTDAINPFEEVRGKERLHCFASQYSTASMIWNASSMTGILCKCCPALPFFKFESYLLLDLLESFA